MIQLFFFKDIQHFVSFIKKIIQKYSLKHHRRLFRLVGTIFSNYLKLSHKTNELKGYRIYFKGKLGKKGSVKKSIIYLSDGQISFTNKNLRYNYKYFLIPTETGVVGCYLACFYT